MAVTVSVSVGHDIAIRAKTVMSVAEGPPAPSLELVLCCLAGFAYPDDQSEEELNSDCPFTCLSFTQRGSEATDDLFGGSLFMDGLAADADAGVLCSRAPMENILCRLHLLFS